MLITVPRRRAAREGSDEEAFVQDLAPGRLLDARNGDRGLTVGAGGVRPGARRGRWRVLGLRRGAARTTVSRRLLRRGACLDGRLTRDGGACRQQDPFASP